MIVPPIEAKKGEQVYEASYKRFNGDTIIWLNASAATYSEADKKMNNYAWEHHKGYYQHTCAVLRK